MVADPTSRGAGGGQIKKRFRGLPFFVGLSVLLHLLLLVGILVFTLSHAGPLAGGGEVIVEIVGNGQAGKGESLASRGGLPRRSEDLSEPHLLRERFRAGKPWTGAKSRNDAGRVPQELRGGPPEATGPGSGLQGSDPILAEIRTRIEQKKRYPMLAKKFGLTGRSLVRFQINPAGDPTEILLKSSSGSKMLDDEALDTVRRAAPYPPYPDPLEIWIHFELNR